MGDFGAMLNELTDAHLRHDGPIPNRRAIFRPVLVKSEPDQLREWTRLYAVQIKKALRELRRPFDDAQQDRAMLQFLDALGRARFCVAKWRATKQQRMAAE